MKESVHREYVEPPAGQMITRFDHCHCFAERKSILAADPICWFCRFAAFDLFSDKLPECGVCRHPEEQPAIPAQVEKELSKEKRRNET